MNEDLQRYIEAHSDAEPEYLRQLERQTNIHLLNGRMCSGHLQGRLLKMLVEMIRPQRVLELGTFSGYSALCIAEGLEGDAFLDTVESDDELEDFIRRTFGSVSQGKRIRLHIADALEFMQHCSDEAYDLIFMDADKRKYPEYYEEAFRILRYGGYIIADNTLWDGHVVEPLKHGDRQTEAIMRFNDLVAADCRVEKVILPMRDGLTLIRKPK